MSKPAKHALTVLAAPELRAQDDTLTQLQAAAAAQVAAVGEMEGKAALGGILAGITLHRVKASMPHGTFGKWIEEKLPSGNFWTPATAKKNASYFMRLALVFLEKANVRVPELLALPADRALDFADSSGSRLADKLRKFAAGKSLNELLVLYGIKGVAREGDEGGEGEGGTTTPAGEDFFAEVATNLAHWRSIVTDKAALVRLNPAQLDTLRDSLSADYAEFQKLYQELRGTKTAPEA
jgi:hypothetical protein